MFFFKILVQFLEITTRYYPRPPRYYPDRALELNQFNTKLKNWITNQPGNNVNSDLLCSVGDENLEWTAGISS